MVYLSKKFSMLRFNNYIFGQAAFRHLGSIVRQHMDASIQYRIGIWIAPRFCSIGEFIFPKHGSPSVKWSASIIFSEYHELHAELLKIVKKRWLRGIPITLSLATADVFAVPVNGDTTALDVEVDILPKGISPNSVDYVILDSPTPACACIRHDDIDFWVNFFKEMGLYTGAVVPSGIWWARFVDGKNEIHFSLPNGSFVSGYSGGSWKGCWFIPEKSKVVSNTCDFTFDVPVKPEYNWCNSFLLPALEGILLTQHRSSFNLNMNSWAAERMAGMEKKIRQYCLKGIITLIFVIATLFATKLGLNYWYMHISHRKSFINVEQVAEMKMEQLRIKKRISSIQAFVSSKNHVTRVFHDAGSLIGDSIWYSEMNIEAHGGVTISIIGHALSESVITRLLNRAESIDGIKTVRLEYTEKVKVSTVELRTIPLFKYKLILNW